MEVNEKHTLSLSSNTVGSGKAVEARKVFVSVLTALRLKKCVDFSIFLNGLGPRKLCQKQMVLKWWYVQEIHCLTLLANRKKRR